MIPVTGQVLRPGKIPVTGICMSPDLHYIIGEFEGCSGNEMMRFLWQDCLLKQAAPKRLPKLQSQFQAFSIKFRLKIFRQGLLIFPGSPHSSPLETQGRAEARVREAAVGRERGFLLWRIYPVLENLRINPARSTTCNTIPIPNAAPFSDPVSSNSSNV